MTRNILINLENVAKSFQLTDGTARMVLENVDFKLHEGEIVALLGKSGSGKSTLLRIMAGLIPTDNGRATYRGNPIYGPASGVAMVFQSFALFPWLTVQQNVELGLEAQGVPMVEREKRADDILEMIGLSGFGGALPRELSGGMKQRVGIARALVTRPDVLLMDEAFSALDVLTGETLRDDMLELWDGDQISTKGILIVSHNIEEAVMMADRILILSSDPGRVRCEIDISLPRPRDAASNEVRALIDEVYGLMTMKPAQGVSVGSESNVHIGYRLPETDITRIEAVLDLLAEPQFDGRADLPKIAEEAQLPDDELFPAYEALSLLGFAHMDGGDITMTPLGRDYVDANQTLKAEIFGQQLLAHIPLAKYIRHNLETDSSGELPEKLFLELLEEHLDSDEAERVLEVAIEWGRYGKVFEYDFHTGKLTLPESEEES
jgi:NitT/TauT family transport system ATP-binding protein